MSRTGYQREQRGLKFYPKSHRYKLDGQWVPGVTTILNKGIAKPFLVDWAAREVAKYAADNLDVLNNIEDTDARYDLLKTAHNRHRDRAAVRGTDVHAYADKLIHGEEIDVPEHLAGYVEGCARFLDAWQPSVGRTERPTASREHWYAGTPDAVVATPDGERLLTVGMTRARRSMVLVSSIRPSSFDDGRLAHGASTLMSILGGLASRGRDSRLEDLADPLTLALARELRRLGASVDVDYRGLLPLVAQHNGKAVVIESDPETLGESLRESLRLRPHVLRRLGWHYVRVHAFDLYSDPVTAASRIATVLGISADAVRADTDTQPIDLPGDD